MHPEVVKDAPGDCPKCGMKLVENKQPVSDNKTFAVTLAAKKHKKGKQ